ncbi:DNA-binding MarR family transcriptional regulator [Bradyrhizobium sp. GM6.1]
MEDGSNELRIPSDARNCNRVRGVHDHGGLDCRWRRGQRLKGRGAAPIHADDACLSVVAQRRDEGFEILAQCDRIENAVRRNLGRRIATQERRDGTIPGIREDLQLLSIRPGIVGKAVQEHDQGAIALFEIGEAHAVGLHVFQGGFGAPGIRLGIRLSCRAPSIHRHSPCDRAPRSKLCAERTYRQVVFCALRTYCRCMEIGIANLLGALSLAVMDRIEQGAREVIGRGGETPAALVVIGYGQGMTNDKLRRILGLSHSGTVRLVDRLVSDRLVERRPGQDGREVALHLTAKGAATRNDLMTSRISAVASLLDVLSPAETKRLETLLHELLARQDTSEMDRFTICRMCDDSACTNCPLPTDKGKRAR